MLLLTQKKYLVFLACLRLSRVRFTVTKRSLLLLLEPKKQKYPRGECLFCGHVLFETEPCRTVVEGISPSLPERMLTALYHVLSSVLVIYFIAVIKSASGRIDLLWLIL